MALNLLRATFPQLSAEAIAAAYKENGYKMVETADALQRHIEQLSGSRKGEMGSSIGSPEAAPRSAARKWVTASSGSVTGARRRCLESPSHSGGASAAESVKKAKRRNRKRNVEQSQPKTEDRESLEQFLFSMLGDEIELGMDIVRDVIYQCQGDTQKSLESLLDIVADSTSVQSPGLGGLLEAFPERPPAEVVKLYKENGGNVEATTDQLLEPTEGKDRTKGKESSYQVLFNEVIHHAGSQETLRRLALDFPGVDKATLLEVLKANGFDYRATSACLVQAGIVPRSRPEAKTTPEALLQQLFKPPEVKDPPKIDEESSVEAFSDWKVVTVKSKIKRKPPKEDINKARDDYEHDRGALENWAAMKQCFKEAAIAYQKGERSRAALLSKKGQHFKELSQIARARASKRIFSTRSQAFQNNITIDLHNQHVDEAVRLVDLHLKALGAIRSVHSLTLITGQGHHACDGKPRLKNAVIAYLNRKGAAWAELNPGCLQVNVQSVQLKAPEN